MTAFRVLMLGLLTCPLMIGCSGVVFTKTITLSAPTFNPPAGAYSNSQSVNISNATAGTTIYYTTNGTAPTTSSTVYSGPIAVNSSETLQAIATETSLTNSPVATAAYIIGSSGQQMLPAPTFNPAAGTYSSSQSVSISDATAGTTIYYTTDGSTPTVLSTVYSGPITVSSSETLLSIATEAGKTNSPVATAAYTIGTAASGQCANPVWSSSNAEGTDGIDSAGLWWVNNDAWNGSAGPQSIYVCNQSSWYAVSNQPDLGGAVETYPDTEYDVGGRNSLSTKTLAQYNSITSTFAEAYPSAGAWDAAYDLWLNNWGTEIMIWNEWAGAQAYWPEQSTQALTLDGVPYHFYNNGGELMFFRDTQVKSGSVDILAAMNWLVSQGLVKSTDVPTQLEYGVEICSTDGSDETFPMTGLTFSLQ
jgi:hypothetical protein